VNLSARAAKAARPSSVLVGTATRDTLGPAVFDTKRVGAFSLKGFAELVLLYRVKRERTPAEPG
jgi:class 3 adenylate cyclase